MHILLNIWRITTRILINANIYYRTNYVVNYKTNIYIVKLLITVYNINNIQTVKIQNGLSVPIVCLFIRGTRGLKTWVRCSAY